MLFLLSPAKSLDYDTPAHVVTHTRPRFVDEAAELIGTLRRKTPAEIAQLMSLSDALATLNVGRYAAWSPRFTAANSKQAALAFNLLNLMLLGSLYFTQRRRLYAGAR